MSKTGKDENLSDTDEEQSTVTRSLSWTWQILGVLLGTATAISIIKNGFAIDVYGLPARVFAQYIWLRETLFAPLVWAVRYFGIEIAWWVKDMIMAYALVGAAHVRAIQLVIQKAWSWYPVPPRFVILLWPTVAAKVLRKWVRAYGDRKYYARHTYGTHPGPFLRPLQHAEADLADATDELGRIALQVIVISVATMAFFLWNYLSGLYGPA